MRTLLIVAVLAACFAVTPARTNAQNGQLIEGLFRTWASTQAEKEKRKRAEAEARLREAELRRPSDQKRPTTNRDPYQVQLPSGFGRPADPRDRADFPAPGFGTPRPGSPLPAGVPGGPGAFPGRPSFPPRQINVRSPEAAAYARQMVAFTRDYGQLVNELRGGAASNPSIGAILPAAFEVSALCETLLDRLDGIESLDRIEGAHRSFDRRYRRVSFDARSINGLSSSCTNLIRKCDRACSTMTKQMGLEPQFDRVALRDVMMTATAYMQILIDDMGMAQMDRNLAHQLQHDGRLLRQQLMGASRELDDMPYDECVTRYSQFINRWQQYSERVYAIDDPYLNRRLDRIGNCADRTYGLLWMPPPVSGAQVASMAHRIAYDLKAISKSMTFFSLSTLRPQQQSKLIATMRDTQRLADELDRVAGRDASRADLASAFSRFDQSWCSIAPLLSRVPTIRQGSLDQIERSCQQLRQILGVRADSAVPVSLVDLVSVAAAMEGTSEYLNRTLQGYSRYLSPSSFRKAVTDSSRSFYQHSREVHELLSRTERLSDQAHLAKLREETDHLLSDWNQLAADLNDVEAHGLTGVRADKIRRAQRDLVPLVGEVAAALLSR